LEEGRLKGAPLDSPEAKEVTPPWSHVKGPFDEKVLAERLRAYLERVPEARALLAEAPPGQDA